MADAHQEPKGGQEPNAHSTPARSRNTRMMLTVLALLIVLAAAGAIMVALQSSGETGGSLSDGRPAAGPANTSP